MYYSENSGFLENQAIDKLFFSVKKSLNYSFLTISLFCCLLYSPFTWSDITIPIFSNVTTRAFSVVWVSNEPVSTASVRVFSDVDGTENITPSLAVSLKSSSKALALGIIKVDVTGAERNTVYFVEVITDDGTGPQTFPVESDPLLDVKTAIETTKSDSENNPIINDLIKEAILHPSGSDAVTPEFAALLLVNVPSTSEYPLSAFVEESVNEETILAAEAMVDMNNMFDKTSGSSAEVVAGEKMELKKFRGLLCNFEDQALVQTRRVPAHEESPPITELESPGACFAPDGVHADFNCDSVIGPLDFFDFQIQFGRDTQSCKFNPDFDLNDDGVIGPLDFFDFQIAFGSVE